jgi:flap endonuclease-1
MGIPYLNAKSEGEATASYLSKRGIVYACVSQDYDSILFGTKRLIRNLTISGKRKVPNKNFYVDIEPEIVEYDQVLKKNNINREQLIDLGILIGTDFNPDGFNGIGPKTALKLIQKFKRLENIDKVKDQLESTPYKQIREIFLNPEVNDTEYQDLQFGNLNKEKIIEFLCKEKNFSLARVSNYIEKLNKTMANKSQSLEKWF